MVMIFAKNAGVMKKYSVQILTWPDDTYDDVKHMPSSLFVRLLFNAVLGTPRLIIMSHFFLVTFKTVFLI